MVEDKVGNKNIGMVGMRVAIISSMFKAAELISSDTK